MADIKEENAQEPHYVTLETPKVEKQVETDEENPQKTKTKRVASLDIFRGLTVAVWVQL